MDFSTNSENYWCEVRSFQCRRRWDVGLDLVRDHVGACDSLCLIAAPVVSGAENMVVCDLALFPSLLRCAATVRRHACIGLYTTTGYFDIAIADQWGAHIVALTILNVVVTHC